jgi:20S proteasome alpha/beta subunit
MASIPAVPVPTSPGTLSQASEPTLSSSTVTLSWNAVSGATSYEVAVRDLGTNQLVADQIVSGTSYQASLSSGHSYRWDVDAIDSAGASNFSSPLYFLTQASVSIPAVPVPTSPGTLSQASEPTLSSSTVTLSWNAVSGATSYEVAVRDLGTNLVVADQIVSGTSYQASLSPGGSYRWDVDAIDSAGASSFSSPLYFLTQASVSIPAVPVPVSPGTASQASEPTLSSSTVTLSWNAVSGATSYEVAVRDMVTNQLVVDQTVSGTSDQVSLSPGGSYRWDVDAIDSAGASSFSSPLYFLTQGSVSVPAVPVPVSPGTASQASEPTLSSSTVTLSWNAVSGATSYEVAVRDLGTNLVVADQIVSGTSYQASLSSGHSYRWDVDAIDSAGASNFSSPLYFLTPGGGGGGGVTDAFIPYTDATPNNPIAADVIAAAEQYIGASWASDNCTGLIWAVSVAVGAPFYETVQTVAAGAGETVQQVMTVVPDDGFIVPPTNPEAGSSTEWETLPVTSNWQSVVQPGDLVRIPAGILAGSPAGHSFIVVGQNSQGQWEVIDNTDPNHVAGSGTGPITISEHTFNTANTLYSEVLDASTAYVSRLVPAVSSTEQGIDYRVQTGTALTGVNTAAIHSDGYQFVGEYLGNVANSGYLTQSDAQTVALPIVSIYERDPTHIGYFTAAQADADANSSASAITAAENVAHQPLGTAIYFTVDPAAEAGVYSGSGALSSAYISAIETYFERISADFAAQGNPYKIGIYGPGDVLTAIKSLNLADVAYYWVDNHWGGTSFSGANIERVSNGVSASPSSIGVSVDTDTALTSDFGQWTPSTVTSTIIESFGSTSLVQTGSNFFLYVNGTTTGPELKYGGAPWAAGQWGGYTPIGAEATATGYEVAFKVAGANQYTVWNTDSNGNITTDPIGTVSGSSTALEALETSFQQDLNGDNVIGIPAPASVVIESFGSTSLVQVGNDFFMYANGTATGPELKYGGTPWAAGQWGGYTPIGAEATATGYEVAFKVAGANQYTVWNTDSNGNITTDPIGTVSGSSTALEALETSFQQDLNGDNVIGIPAPASVVIESFGSTSLVQVGNDFFMYANGTITGPELKYGGAPWVAGQWGGYVPIGAEATATGYEVAFKVAGADQYTVWNTDSNGNITTDPIGTVSGTSTALEALETSFHQDLNNDNVIGIPAAPSVVIESFGSTSLVEVGNDFFLYANGTTTGPELKYGGVPWVAGQWGGYTPIGAEATATGYEVAFKVTGADAYTVWNTDSSGNITIDPIGTVSGSSTALEALETSFHQDLNGDNVTGIPAPTGVVIESFGSTSLVQVGNDFFMYANGTTTGPELKYGGAPWAAGEWGGYTPIGAEATATGYEVAFKVAGADAYTAWNTDSNGNITTDPIGTVTASSTALQALETSFHQDLNNDGMIGIPGTIESFGSTSLVQTGSDFFIYANGTTTGPELKYGGAPWATGLWGGWTPIGAEATATGYEVAFKVAGGNQYTVWNTDANGNITSDSIGSVPASSSALQSLETSFHQDLNGDGTIGPAAGSSTAGSAAAATTSQAIITAPASGNSVLSGSAASDTFVFGPHFGNDTISNFKTGIDQVDIDHTLFASVSDLVAHTADGANGNAVITVTAGQSITFQDTSTLTLQQHLTDFHLV